MKRTLSLATALAVSVLVISCDNSPEPSVDADDVQREVDEAADATAAYVDEAKDDFVRSMENNLAKLDREIDQLEAKSETLAADAKAEARQKLAELRQKYAGLEQQAARAKESTKEGWAELKQGFASAYDELEQSIQQAKEKFD